MGRFCTGCLPCAWGKEGEGWVTTGFLGTGGGDEHEAYVALYNLIWEWWLILVVEVLRLHQQALVKVKGAEARAIVLRGLGKLTQIRLREGLKRCRCAINATGGVYGMLEGFQKQANPYFQRRTHCRQGQPLTLWERVRGRGILRKRQTDGRISRLCRRCFEARWNAYQRQQRLRALL